MAAFMLVTMTLFSCKKDDGGSVKTPAELIIGKWYPVSAISDKPYQWASNNYGTDGFAGLGDCIETSTLTFSQGATAGTGIVQAYDDCQKANVEDSYILQSNTLTLINSGDRTIEKLDGSNLVFSYTRYVGGQAIKFTNGFKK